jgi:hypothetical protein
MMAQRRSESTQYLIVDEHQRLVAVPLDLDGREVTCYFVEGEAADPAPIPEAVREALVAAGAWDELTRDRALEQLDPVTRDALGVIGAWEDLDWDEMVASLDRIRHESVPTPPIEL